MRSKQLSVDWTVECRLRALARAGSTCGSNELSASGI